MDYVNFGKTGLKVSRLCLGMMTYGSKKWREWVLEEAEARPFVKRALEAGINFFDTADVYSLGASEEVLGNTLRFLKTRRDDLVIATKVFNEMSDDPNDRGLSRKHILASIDASLRRLQMDYVDLYQIHRWDYDTPVEETMEALHDVVKAGKARYIGASSMFAWQFTKAQYLADLHGWTRFVSMQNHYNLIYREEEREMISLCEAEGIAVIPWSPLARGLLAGTRKVPDDKTATARSASDDFAWKLYDHPSDVNVMRACEEVAAKRGVQPAQVAIAWLLSKPVVTAPIIGATKIEHLEAALAAVDLVLSDEEIRQLETPYQPHAVRGFD
jgi:aryl-alcohol dehydrogenase-like predicted oxidoreductase